MSPGPLGRQEGYPETSLAAAAAAVWRGGWGGRSISGLQEAPRLRGSLGFSHFLLGHRSRLECRNAAEEVPPRRPDRLPDHGGRDGRGRRGRERGRGRSLGGGDEPPR